MTTITDSQREILRRAISARGQLRDLIVALPWSEDHENCKALADAGMLRRSYIDVGFGGNCVYRVTEKGREAAK